MQSASFDRLSERHFRSIADLIESKVGIKLPPTKRTMVEGRLRKRVRALGLPNLDGYAVHLFDGRGLDAEFVHLVDCVTTNKTDFFREAMHFDFVRDVAISDLLKRRRSGEARLKFWSAACSIGAEAYTLAMVLSDMQRAGTAKPFLFSILGTDISTDVLAQAERGVFSREMVQPVPPAMAQRYLLHSRDARRAEVRIVPELRRRTHFMQLNLMDDRYGVDRDVDLIFCRNVLIYFDKPTQAAVLTKLRSHLRPGGFLVLGHAESMAGSECGALRQILPTIFQA